MKKRTVIRAVAEALIVMAMVASWHTVVQATPLPAVDCDVDAVTGTTTIVNNTTSPIGGVAPMSVHVLSKSALTQFLRSEHVRCEDLDTAEGSIPLSAQTLSVSATVPSEPTFSANQRGPNFQLGLLSRFNATATYNVALFGGLRAGVGIAGDERFSGHSETSRVRHDDSALPYLQTLPVATLSFPILHTGLNAQAGWLYKTETFQKPGFGKLGYGVSATIHF
jgi:hypothetical protein